MHAGCVSMRDNTSRNQANGSTPQRLHVAMKREFPATVRDAENLGRGRPKLAGLTLPSQPVEKSLHFDLASLGNENTAISQINSVGSASGVRYFQLMASHGAPSVLGHKFAVFQYQASSIPNTAAVNVPSWIVHAMLPPADCTADANSVFGNVSRPTPFEGVTVNARHNELGTRNENRCRNRSANTQSRTAPQRMQYF
jgi:hypothetical protein